MALSDDDDRDSDDSILPGPSNDYDFYGEEEVMDVDDVLCTLLASLHLEQSRDLVPTEHDDDTLRLVHEKMKMAMVREMDDSRRRRLNSSLGPTKCIREQVLYLRRLQRVSNARPAPIYFPTLSEALTKIVNKSFDEEYRKIAILLGLVEALAEVLVLEVRVFGTRADAHRGVRKLIANALTNLTFGHMPSKRRLCAYSMFMSTVVRVIAEARNLAQVYSGLIRNLSWMADPEMMQSLSICVPVLARAAIVAKESNDENCIRATLSALWNLSGNSCDSRAVICNEPGCLRMLISLLTPDASQTTTVDAATGILKYACQHLSKTSDCMAERPLLAAALVQLLASASFTIAANVLGALSSLIAKDPHLQMEIVHNPKAMHQLNSLRQSAKEDIRGMVKTILNHLNQPSGYTPRYSGMSSSMGVSSGLGSLGMEPSQQHRLLQLRAVRASPGAPMVPPPGMGLPSPAMTSQYATVEQRSTSLPRHYVGRRTATGPQGSNNASPSHFAGPSSSGFQQMPAPSNQQPVQHSHPTANPYEKDECDDEMAAIIDEEAYQRSVSEVCNRSNLTSRQSLESSPLNQSGWNSTIDTSANSRLSPVSPSELPDSPTHYTIVKMEQEMEERRRNGQVDTSTPLRVSVRPSTSSGEQSRMTCSDTTTALVEDQATPTSNNAHYHTVHSYPPVERNSIGDDAAGPSEGDYALVGGLGGLDQFIESALPQQTPTRGRRSKGSPFAAGGGDDLLASMIQSALPSPRRGPPRHASRSDSDRLLMDSIMSEMPMSPGSTLPKNEMGGRATTDVVRPSLNGHQHIIETDEEPSTSSPYEDTTDGVSREPMKRRDSFGSSDEDFGRDDAVDNVDTTLPTDCVDEQLTIDCSSISTPRSRAITSSAGKRSATRTGIPQPTRLPTPTKRVANSPSSFRAPLVKPPVAPKPQTVVPPYNYQKPKEVGQPGRTSPDPKAASVHHKPVNTMLVTTV